MFDRTTFEENDPIARKAALILLNDCRGYSFVENPDIYGIDLVSGTIGVEVERRPNWGDTPFPYRMVNIPFRKFKMLRSGLINHFLIFNKSCKKAVYISHKVLQEYIKKDNITTLLANTPHQGKVWDSFFRIPLEKCRVIDLT